MKKKIEMYEMNAKAGQATLRWPKTQSPSSWISRTLEWALDSTVTTSCAKYLRYAHACSSIRKILNEWMNEWKNIYFSPYKMNITVKNLFSRIVIKDCQLSQITHLNLRNIYIIIYNIYSYKIHISEYANH